MESPNQMTTTARFKRSCVGAIFAVIASTGALLALGFSENHAASGVGDLQADLLGVPLAPGWFVMRGTIENINLSSLNHILGPALLTLFISVVIDTGLIFVVWELFHWQKSRQRGSTE
jgi:hypothetical protein